MPKQKLTKALERFFDAMTRRIRQKQREGFTGWDSSLFWADDVPKRMHDKSLNVLLQSDKCDPQDLVDIANMAMMLHYRRTKND